MLGQNDVTFVPGDAILGIACLAMPPFSSAGYWFEVDNGIPDSIWTEIKPTVAFVVYKGDQNGS